MFLFCERGEGGSNIKCDIVGGGGGARKSAKSTSAKSALGHLWMIP